MGIHSKYWCDCALVVTVNGPHGSSSIELGKPFARVGSHDCGEVVLRDKDIPRRWLYFHATDEGVFWIKLSRSPSGSQNTCGWFEPGEFLVFGAYRIGARIAREPPDWRERRENLAAPGSAGAVRPVLNMTRPGKANVEKRINLTRCLTLVGRCEPATVQLSGHSVSRSHCVLHVEKDALWVIDLLSSNRTRVSGTPIDAGILAAGDILELGEANLKHEGLEPIYSPTRKKKAVAARNDSELKAKVADLQQQVRHLEIQKSEWEQTHSKRRSKLAREWAELRKERARLDKERARLRAMRDELLAQQASLRFDQQPTKNDLAGSANIRDIDREPWQEDPDTAVLKLPAIQIGHTTPARAAETRRGNTSGRAVAAARINPEPNHSRAGLGDIDTKALNHADQESAVARDDQQELLGAIAAFHRRKQISRGILATFLGLLGRRSG